MRQRKPQTHLLLHHSDRGSHYTSTPYQQLLTDHHSHVSMSSIGNCYDNAPMKSFFAQLKLEEVYRHRYPTRQAAMSSIFAYIEGFYNIRRLHSAIDYRSPLQFEAEKLQPAVAYLPVH